MRITAKPADGNGSVAGFEATCYECGMRLTNTFDGELRRDIADHLAYHDRVAARLERRLEGRVS